MTVRVVTQDFEFFYDADRFTLLKGSITVIDSQAKTHTFTLEEVGLIEIVPDGIADVVFGRVPQGYETIN